MSESKFQVIFKGQLEKSFELQQVKDNLASKFKKNLNEIDTLFSGKPVVLSKNIDLKKARKLAAVLSQLGAIVEVAPITKQTTAPVGPLQKLAAIRAKEKTKVLRKPVLEFANAELKEVDKKSWLRYRFDTFMAKGGSSIFKALTATFLISFVVIALFRGAFLFFFPDAALQYQNLGFLGNVYITFLQLTDPGNMAQDILSSPAYKFFSVIAGIAGIIMLSALIAFITTSLDQKISDLKRGRSKVIENGHTLILGWNEQRILEIIRELVLANESEDDGCVVVLANKDKEEMDDALRLNIPDSMSTRLVTRNGNVSNFANLDMVSIERAKAVIILADCNDTDSAAKKSISDAKAIQTVLATTGLGTQGDEDFCIIVEIFNPTHRQIISSTFPDNVITVNTSDILAKLLVQTSRSVGLSVVYNEILSFDGCEMYFYDDDAEDWDGQRFADIAFHFPDGVPIGVRSANGDITMNPSVDYIMRADDSILIVADDDSTIEYMANPVAVASEYKLVGGRLPQLQERELVLGWNHKSAIILREFADYVKDGSQVHVLLNNPTDAQRAEIEALDVELDELEIRLIEKDRLNRDDLLELKPFEYDNIIILASNDGESDDIDTQQVDSENIVALLLLRSIFNANAENNRNTKLITEILDSQNYPLVARAGVKDVIISNRLVSMIMAQISESRDIQKVYDDIFQEDGSEIYLKPASLYFESFPVDVSFADLMAIAQKREEVCIGVKIKALEEVDNENSGVSLIPLKNNRFVMHANDSLVVLAEDEL